MALDNLGPLRTTSKGNKWILVAIDILTRYIILIALPEATAEQKVHIISKFGAPSKFFSDQGAAFQSKVMEDLARIFKIEIQPRRD